jgi:hypothetical protein
MKRGDFIAITKGEYKGRKGQLIRKTEEGELEILLDLDGDPLTPPIVVKIPARWGKAMRIINFFLNILLPILYGLKRK